ncbi:protein-lysine methyltransferase METTL21D [Orussus abietinus]|uniref:protein-lysine methyltransferase METTL21D n=1 Tax=Orussus abietinus TaxID=222816 RepID=UPI000626C264|nr:protein-lysine methyltransferase METTL21D [Orussus abietinus]
MGGMEDMFTRELTLDSCNKTLTFYQRVVGDVSSVVWDASIVLAKYLDTLAAIDRNGINWLCGKIVLELGSGLGCVGMTAACLGAQVYLTDLESALPMLKYNVKMNEKWKDSGGSVIVQALDWCTDLSLNTKPDLVVLADCVYYKESIKPLLDTLDTICKGDKHSEIIFCQEERNTPGQIPIWQEFIDQLKLRFNVERIPLSEQHPVYCSSDIHLMKLSKI